MSRPEFVTNEDIARWSNNIDNDPDFPKALAESPIIREVCYAGLWLAEELEKLHCPQELITRIQFTAGQISFGRDAWEVHQTVLNDFVNDKLTFEKEPDYQIN